MGVIIPAILPTSRDDLEGKLAQLEGLADTVQIDLVDGIFAKPASWPYINKSERFEQRLMDGEALPYLGSFNFELDLMVSNPEEVTGLWIAAGAQRVVIHAESTRFLDQIISDLEVKYGHAKGFAPGLLSLGLSISNDTDLSLIDPYVDKVDFVQFMGIAHIGKQGEPFDARVIEKIRTFRKKYPNTVVQVDGAVSLETAARLLTAGVDRLIIGSALWKGHSVKEELSKFQALLQEYGVYL